MNKIAPAARCSAEKHNPHVEIRPTLPEDLMKFYDLDHIPFSLKGISFFYDGELKGLGGVRFCNGFFLAFSDFDESVKVNDVTKYRVAMEVMKVVKDMKMQVFAEAKHKGMSGRLLKRLGWRLYFTKDEEEFYVYG